MYTRMGDLAEKVTAALGNQAPASLDNAPAAWSKDAVNWALENRLLLGIQTATSSCGEISPVNSSA